MSKEASMVRTILFAGVAGSMFAQGAVAAETKRAPQTDATPFDKADADHDGHVTKAEVAALRQTSRLQSK